MIRNALMRFSYNQLWNIGFTRDSIESFFKKKYLGKIQWLKHKYKDRFFADPFVLSITDNTIEILAEEYLFSQEKGRIVQLSIDKKSFRLLKNIVIIEAPYHLSYPAVYFLENKIYIFPESSVSGALWYYYYDENKSVAIPVNVLIKEPLIDATICFFKGKYWLIGSKIIRAKVHTYLYVADNLFGNYSQVSEILPNEGSGRSAGHIFYDGKNLYRPSQLCKNRYGEGIIINLIEDINYNGLIERPLFSILPKSFRYNLGLHTINFFEGGCVLDGCGYLFPIMGRQLNLLSIIKRRYLGLSRKLLGRYLTN